MTELVMVETPCLRCKREVKAVQDSEDIHQFHYECHACGDSKSVFIKKPPKV